MASILPAALFGLTACLVFADGWRMLPRHYCLPGGIVALILFVFHPAARLSIHASSPWDAVFVMLFLTAWLWMEHWSLFMRSWVLAGIYAFGFWVGSPFVLWGLMAMVPWVVFNRRPLAAVGSFLTVFLGGLLIFSATWGAAWLVMPEIGRPIFTQWIRWGGLQRPPAFSLPWFVLACGAVLERCRVMFNERRSDASMFAAVLILVTCLFGSPDSGLVLIALSAPLIARILVKKEFLFHRRVRWVTGVTFALVLGVGALFRRESWLLTGTAMLAAGIGARWIYRNYRLPRFMSGEAICVGAFLADSLGTVLHLF